MAENKKQYDIEVVQEGFANGVAPGFPLNDKENEKMINKYENIENSRVSEIYSEFKNENIEYG